MEHHLTADRQSSSGQEELYAAVRAGSLDKALFLACTAGSLEIARSLLADKRVDPTASYYRPLQSACASGNVALVRLLLDDKRVRPNEGLYDAFKSGNQEIVETLLRDDRFDMKKYGSNALDLACEYGHVELVKKLLSEYHVNPHDKNSDALSIAARAGSIAVVRLLLHNYRVRPTQTALNAAAEGGHLEIFKILCEYPNMDVRCALESAGNFEVLNFIFQSGRVAYQDVFEVACKNGSLDFVNFILGHTFVPPQGDLVDLDCNYLPGINLERGFFYALQRHSYAVIKAFLVDGRVNPAANDAFLQVVKMHNEEILRLFLNDPRVDPSIHNSDALRATYDSTYSCEDLDVEALKILVEDRRLNLAARGNRILRTAIRNCDIEVVTLLLSKVREGRPIPLDGLWNLARRWCVKPEQIDRSESELESEDRNITGSFKSFVDHFARVFCQQHDVMFAADAFSKWLENRDYWKLILLFGESELSRVYPVLWASFGRQFRWFQHRFLDRFYDPNNASKGSGYHRVLESYQAHAKKCKR